MVFLTPAHKSKQKKCYFIILVQVIFDHGFLPQKIKFVYL